jgi:replication factor A1
MTSEIENESEKNEEILKKDIASLEPRMKTVNVTFKVIGKSDVREVSSRRDGDLHRVVDATVGDSSGTVQLPLWDSSIEAIETGKTYFLENGYTGLFRGNLQLKMGRHSEIKEAEEGIEDVNLELDMSAKDHREPRDQHYYQPMRGSGYRGSSYGGRSYGRNQSRDRRDRRRRRW